MKIHLTPKQLKLLWSIVEQRMYKAYEDGEPNAEEIKKLLFAIEQAAGYSGYDLIALSKL